MVWLEAVTAAESTRLFSCSAPVGNGSIVIYGGLSQSFFPLSDMIVFNAASGTTTRFDSVGTTDPHTVMGAYLAADSPDTLLLYGGFNLAGASNKLARYSLVNQSFTAVPLPPTAPSVCVHELKRLPLLTLTSFMAVFSWLFAATLSGDELLVVGGSNVSLLEQGLRPSAVDFSPGTYLINVTARTVRFLPSDMAPWRRQGAAAALVDCFPPARSGRPCTLLFGGQGFTAAGMISFNDTWLFDPDDAAWRRLTPPVAPVARSFHTLTVLSATKLLLTGGQTLLGFDQLFEPPFLSDLWVGAFDAGSGEWAWTQLQAAGMAGTWGMPVVADRAAGSVTFFGGLAAVGNSAVLGDSATALTVRPGCNPGARAGDFFAEACVPCPRGTFSAVSNGVCQPCPAHTSTPVPGAHSAGNCSVCADSTPCHHHGTCSVTFTADSTPVFSCACHVGWFGESCKWSVAGLTVLIMVGAGVSWAIRLLVVRWYRKRVARMKEVRDWPRVGRVPKNGGRGASPWAGLVWFGLPWLGSSWRTRSCRSTCWRTGRGRLPSSSLCGRSTRRSSPPR